MKNSVQKHFEQTQKERFELMAKKYTHVSSTLKKIYKQILRKKPREPNKNYYLHFDCCKKNGKKLNIKNCKVIAFEKNLCCYIMKSYVWRFDVVLMIKFWMKYLDNI